MYRLEGCSERNKHWANLLLTTGVTARRIARFVDWLTEEAQARQVSGTGWKVAKLGRVNRPDD